MLHQAYNNGPVPIQAAARHMTEARGEGGGGSAHESTNLLNPISHIPVPPYRQRVKGAIANE